MSVINGKIAKCNRISFVKYSAYLCGIAKMIKAAGEFPYPALLIIYPQITCSAELILLFFFSCQPNTIQLLTVLESE